MNYLIKTATLEDVPTLVTLWTKFMEAHTDIVTTKDPRLISMEEKLDTAAQSYHNYVDDLIRTDKGAAFIAHSNNRPIGYALVCLKPTIPIFKEETTGQLLDLYVRDDFRRKGVSTALKSAFMAWFSEKSIRYLSILVFSANEAARKVYQKWGYFDYKLEMRREI